MKALYELFLMRDELLSQRFYNQPAVDVNNKMIQHFMDKLSIPEINEAYKMAYERG